MACSSCSKKVLVPNDGVRAECVKLRSFFNNLFTRQKADLIARRRLALLSELGVTLPALSYYNVIIEREDGDVLFINAKPNDESQLYRSLAYVVYTYNPNRLKLPSLQYILSVYSATPENVEKIKSSLPKGQSRNMYKFPFVKKNVC